MNKNIIIAIIAILVLGGGGAYYYTTTNNTKTVVTASDGHTDHTDAEEINQMANMDHSQMNMAGLGAKEAGTRVIIKNTTLKAGIQELSFQVYGTDGDSWGDKDLKIAHEKKMHFIVVSNDFSNYQHIHPTFSGDTWKVNVNLKDKTGYQAYIDVDSDEVGAEVLRIPLSVGSVTNTGKVSQNNTKIEKTGISVEISGVNNLMIGKSTEIVFAVKKNGQLTSPENYLGAKGHTVALSNDPSIFIHGHPDEHADTKEVHFAFTFQKEGTYTLFAQFQVDGKVETYPFTVKVVDESKPHTDTVPHN